MQGRDESVLRNSDQLRTQSYRSRQTAFREICLDCPKADIQASRVSVLARLQRFAGNRGVARALGGPGKDLQRCALGTCHCDGKDAQHRADASRRLSGAVGALQRTTGNAETRTLLER